MTIHSPLQTPINAAMITSAVLGARMGNRRKKNQPGQTFAWLCDEFRKSPKWLSLEFNSRKTWGLELDFACRDDVLGHVSLDEIRPALIQGYLDGWADKPSKQRNALSAFKALERWAIVRDLLARSISLGIEIGETQGGHMPWTEEQVELARHKARSDIARVVTLGANTGQRGSDLVRMGWADVETFDGRDWIAITQKKTSRPVFIPIFKPLADAMATWEKRPGPFCLDKHGKPWTRERLTNAWIYERDNNPELKPLAGLVLHGLRGHACVHLFREGLNNKDIATLVGMSPPMVETYTKLSEKRLDAIAAVIHLENFRGTSGPKVGKTGNEIA